MRYNPKIYRLVESNVYDIPQRLKEIDSGYYILFNRITGQFQVHNENNIGNSTYCFTVPYEELDARTIDYCIQTRRENLLKLIEEMERNNEKLEQDRDNKFYDEVGEIAKDIYRYADKDGDETRLTTPAIKWKKGSYSLNSQEGNSL